MIFSINRSVDGGDTKRYKRCYKLDISSLRLERARGQRPTLEVLREEGIDAVRYALWDATGWHRDYSPPAWRHRATEEQKRVGWEMAVRIEKILCTVLGEAHKRQVEEAMDTLSEGPERFYKSYLD